MPMDPPLRALIRRRGPNEAQILCSYPVQHRVVFFVSLQQLF